MKQNEMRYYQNLQFKQLGTFQLYLVGEKQQYFQSCHVVFKFVVELCLWLLLGAFSMVI